MCFAGEDGLNAAAAGHKAVRPRFCAYNMASTAHGMLSEPISNVSLIVG